MTTWYRTGTIAVTNGSTAVTGTGTAWIENVRIGDALHAPDGRVYEIANVSSDTSLTLASNFLGSTASGQDYAIQPTRGVIASFRDTVQTWISSIQSYIDGALAGRFGDGTQSEPGVAFANDLDTGVRRSGSNELRVVSGGSDRVTINSAGNVGIGTTSPGATLDVNGSLSVPQGQRIDFAGPTADKEYIVSDTTGQISLFCRGAVEIVSDSNDNGSDSIAIFTVSEGATSRTEATERLVVTKAGNVGIGTTSPGATLDVNGSLSKSSGSFKIDHPLPALSDTHYLVHSFVEGPRADNIYRGRAVLVGGTATVDLDDAAGMTSGTFAALNGDVQVWLQNDTGWEPVRGEVVGATLTITCRDGSSTDTVSWLVIGERQDQHMLETQWTDEYGRVTLEPLKPAPEEEPV